MNGKIYIGKHQTKNLNDDYLGSGKLISRAVDKHGVDKFKKEVLFIFDNEDEMNAKEKELVTPEFCKENTNYNLCPGGHGGFGYLNENGLNNSGIRKNKFNVGILHSNRLKFDLEYREKFVNKTKQTHKNGKIRYDTNTGKKRSEETKRKTLETFKRNKHQQGEKNSNYGKIWITDGNKNLKITNMEKIPDGYFRGRTFSEDYLKKLSEKMKSEENPMKKLR